MVTAIGSTSSTANSNGSQIAVLERELANYEKQLQQAVGTGGGPASAATAQLVAVEISVVEAQISELATPVAASPSSTLGTHLNVTA